MSDWWDRIRELEPARVRAVWVAIVALAVSLGVVVNTDVDSAVQALIVAVFTLLPLLQGEATRRKVTPVAKLDRLPEPVDPDDSDMVDVGGDPIDMHNYESGGE